MCIHSFNSEMPKGFHHKNVNEIKVMTGFLQNDYKSTSQEKGAGPLEDWLFIGIKRGKTKLLKSMAQS